MKILYLLVCLIIFSSCSEETSHPFNVPFSYDVTFSDGEITVDGKLFYDGKEMVFSPEVPSGYKVTVTEEGGQIEYEGIVFDENVLPSSRFLPLYNVLRSISEGNTDGVTATGLKKDNIKITVNKDIE